MNRNMMISMQKVGRFLAKFAKSRTYLEYEMTTAEWAIIFGAPRTWSMHVGRDNADGPLNEKRVRIWFMPPRACEDCDTPAPDGQWRHDSREHFPRSQRWLCGRCGKKLPT